MNEDRGLGVDAGGDHEGGVGVARLVEAQALANSSVVPNAVGVSVEPLRLKGGLSKPNLRL